MLRSFPAELHFFLYSLAPRTIKASVAVILSDDVPSYAKPILVSLACAHFGIRDDIVVAVGLLMKRHALMDTALHLEMDFLMHHMRDTRNLAHVAEAVGDFVLRQCGDAGASVGD